ncbi:hypothetical protein CYMTET_34234, partial [Cymbomonas tetramitiformis]
DGRVEFVHAGGLPKMTAMLRVKTLRVVHLSAVALVYFGRDKETINAVANSGLARGIMDDLLISIQRGAYNLAIVNNVPFGPFLKMVKPGHKVERDDEKSMLPVLVNAACGDVWAMACASVASEGAEDDPTIEELKDILICAGALLELKGVEIGRAASCLTGTLCMLSRQFLMAEMLVHSREKIWLADVVLGLMRPAGKEGSCKSQRSGHIRAPSVAMVAHLFGHHFDMAGEGSLSGPFRSILSGYPFFTGVLGALLAPTENIEMEKLLHATGGCALMLICTECGALEAEALSLFLTYTESKAATVSLQVFLMASMWLLLLDDLNRVWLINAPLDREKVSEPKLSPVFPFQPLPPGPEELGRTLRVLGAVGGSLVPALEAAGEDPEADAVVAATFWVGSLHLAMVDPEEENRCHEQPYELYESTVWTVTSMNPRTPLPRSTLTSTAVKQLCRIIATTCPGGRTVRQLAIALTWNLALRDLGIEQQLVLSGVADSLVSIALDEENPVEMRSTAFGHIQMLLEGKEGNMTLMGGPGAMWTVLTSFMRSPEDKLQEVGARGMAWAAVNREHKGPLANVGGIDDAFRLLARHVEGNKDVAYAATCLLLNLSQATANQVPIARKGVLLLTRISQHADVDMKIRQMAHGILHNVRMHAANRNRFYKLELKLKQEQARRSPSDQGLGLHEAAGEEALDSTLQALRTASSLTAASKSPHVTSLPSIRSSTPGASHMRMHTDRPQSLFNHWADETFDPAKEKARKPMTGRKAFIARMSVPKSRKDEPMGMPMTETSMLYCRDGWVDGVQPIIGPDNDPAEWSGRTPLPKLVQAMRQPQHAAWGFSPGREDSKMVAKPGQERWAPSIDHYNQYPAKQRLSTPAAKMLNIQRPDSVIGRLADAAECIAIATANDELAPNGTLIRPPRVESIQLDPPAEIENSTVPLTIAQLHHPKHWSDPFAASSMASKAPANAISPRPKPRAPPPASHPLLGGGLRGETPPKQEPEPVEEDYHVVNGLTVHVGQAKSHRNEITFAAGCMGRPRIALFEHVDGSKVYDGLFPVYNLPSGMKAHYYDHDNKVTDEVEVAREPIPGQPRTLYALLRLSLPPTDVLTLLLHPNRDQMPVLRPVPQCVPPLNLILNPNLSLRLPGPRNVQWRFASERWVPRDVHHYFFHLLG